MVVPVLDGVPQVATTVVRVKVGQREVVRVVDEHLSVLLHRPDVDEHHTAQHAHAHP